MLSDLLLLLDENVEWQWPWMLYGLLLPLVIQFWPNSSQSSVQGALEVPFLERISEITQGTKAKRSHRHWLKYGWLWVLWFLLVLASARPISIGEAVTLPREGRSLILAVDISKSMLRNDMVLNGSRVSRIQAVKSVLKTFLEQRQGDKVGLVLFGSEAFLQSPLTFDLKTLQSFIDETHVGLAGNQTAIGDGLGLSIKQMEQHPGEGVLILLSDGDNTAGSVLPEKAAAFAYKQGIKVYTIAFGKDFFGRALKSKTLSQIADITKGRSFKARNTKDLAEIYKEIDALETIDDDQDFYRPSTEEYYRVLKVALLWLIMGLVVLGLTQWVSRKQQTNS